MLNEFKCKDQSSWDEVKIAECCPDPPVVPPDPTSGCCYNTWLLEKKEVDWQLQEVTNELNHAQKHLAVLVTRTGRLKTWDDELTSANEQARKICCQLELIETQIQNICKNTHFTIKSIEILYCMIREFYVVVDCLQVKYDCLINCIKCLNNPKLSLTQGIGKYLADYGTALAAVIQTRDTLIALVMSVIDTAIKLHREVCDHYGYKKLIQEWIDTIKCGVECDEENHPEHRRQENRPDYSGSDIIPEEPFCLDPILSFPICKDSYFKDIRLWYEIDVEEVKILTHDVKELVKKQLALQACQQSLANALKEVNPTARCS